MPIDNKILDDLARVAGGAVSLVSSVRKQVQSDLQGRVDAVADRMDLAPKAEIERLQSMVAGFRAEQELLKKRIHDLEILVKGKPPAAARKSTAATPGKAKAKPQRKAKRK